MGFFKVEILSVIIYFNATMIINFLTWRSDAMTVRSFFDALFYSMPTILNKYMIFLSKNQ
jgi:hypothetical protein